MKGLDQKIAAVQQAEAECARQRMDAHLAWHQLKDEVKRTATPARIVVSGLALGFVSGFTTSGGAAAASGKFVSGPIFSMLLDTVVPGLLAGITAAATSSTEEEDEQEAAEGEPGEDADEPAAAQAPAPPEVRRGRRRA